MSDGTQSGDCEIYSRIPDVYLTQVIGAHAMDGTKLLTIETVNVDGSTSYQNFPIPIAIALADKILTLGIDSQMRDSLK